MSCPFCGCFNGMSRGMPGYEPEDEDFDRAKEAARLMALVVAQHDGELKVEWRDYERMREIVAEFYGDWKKA